MFLDEYVLNYFTLLYGFFFQILIKGTVGTGYQGDIAVDDITFTSGGGCSRKYGLIL